MNRRLDVELITTLIRRLRPNESERDAIRGALCVHTGNAAEVQPDIQGDKTLRMASRLAMPVLWSDLQMKYWREMAGEDLDPTLAFAADEWSLTWKIDRQALPNSPVAFLVPPKYIGLETQRPLTYYDLWCTFHDADDVRRLPGHESYVRAFARKVGTPVFEDDITGRVVRGWGPWKRHAVERRLRRIPLGDVVQASVRQRIRSRDGWYSPADFAE